MAPPLHSPALISTTLPSTLRIVSPVPSSPWCRRARPLASAGLGGAARRDWRRRRSTRGRRGMRICAYTAEAEHGSSEEDVADDFYSVLGVMPDATSEEIKKAYYSCMKTCHPDLSGGHPDVTNFSMFINEVYTVLSDPVQRAVYDEIHGYTTTATNPFVDDSAVKNHVFVDEFTCIEFAPTCAPVSLKLRKTLGGQESAPRGVARTSFRMPLIVAQLTVFAGLLLHNFHSLRVKHEE